MSWSVQAIGKVGPVAASVQADLTANKCEDPEQGVKEEAMHAIAAALAAQSPETYVRVNASGYQRVVYEKDGKLGFQNTLKIEVEPIYGFKE